MGELIRLSTTGRRAQANVALTEQAMEAQVALRSLRRESGVLWDAARATGNMAVLSEVRDLAQLLAVAERRARRIAGIADTMTCPDGRSGKASRCGRAA